MLTAFLSGTVSPIEPTWETAYYLTDVGTADWAHWTDTNSNGTGPTKVSKSGGGGQITNLTPYNHGNGGDYGIYFDSSDTQVAWTDGPDAPDPHYDRTKIWQNADVSVAADEAGWTFSVPADTFGKLGTVTYLLPP